MKFSMKKNESGFSLVELMVVVGIIGILASLALPKLGVFMAKSKQAEAKTSLAAHNSLQQSYYADNNLYAVPATVGWVATGGRYTITTPAALDGSGIATSGTSTTGNICNGQTTADVWNMTIARVITTSTSITGLGCTF